MQQCRDVYPDESILALEQRLELLDGTLLNALIGYQANVHPARHLPELRSAAPDQQQESMRMDST
jgi:hypothetical protein